MTDSVFGSADGHLPYASTVPGSYRAGPYVPGGAPYGRTEYGRPRRARDEIPGMGKGLNFGQNRDFANVRVLPLLLSNDPDLI